MADQDRLRDVVVKVVEVLDEVVKSRYILFPKNLRDKIDKAWKELNEIKSEQDGTTTKVGQIKNNVGQAEDSRLRDVGLAGEQLELKTFGFLESYNERGEKGGLGDSSGFSNTRKTSSTAWEA